jgi:hypothetical protein
VGAIVVLVLVSVSVLTSVVVVVVELVGWGPYSFQEKPWHRPSNGSPAVEPTTKAAGGKRRTNALRKDCYCYYYHFYYYLSLAS